MSKINANVFLLNNIRNLDDLNQITDSGYREILKHTPKDADVVNALPDNQKYYEYTWQEVGAIEEFSVSHYDLFEENLEDLEEAGNEILEEAETEETIRYVKVTGNIEYATKKRKADDGTFLPKEERLNDTDTNMIFFELRNQIFVLILTSNFYLLERTKNLIGAHNISPTNDLYSLNTDLFTWLFYIFTECNGILETGLLLENIDGFIGNVTDNANVITGTSRQTTELIVTKAFISTGEELKNVAIRISNQEIDITCSVNEKSSVIINCTDSVKLRILDNVDKKEFLLLYFYGYLILRIKELYEQNRESFIDVENPLFAKKIGLDVIENIIMRNNISLEEVEDLFLNEDDQINVEIV